MRAVRRAVDEDVDEMAVRGGGVLARPEDADLVAHAAAPEPADAQARFDRLGIRDGGVIAAHALHHQPDAGRGVDVEPRSEEHTSELQSLMRISYAVFYLKQKKQT